MRFVIPAAAFAALLGAFLYALTARNEDQDPVYDPMLIESPLVGRTAPQFSTPSLADATRRVASGEFQGKAYVLNVWGTWCGGCREEHPALVAIAAETEVPIIGLDWKDDHQAAQQWLGQLGNPYHAVGVDDDGKIAIDWGVYGAPETFLVGADGRVLHKRVGPMSVEIWRSQFAPKLRPGGARP